ncbi:MAG: antitoxin family protein [Fimbriimonadales bacterium]|nr:antitoxin family protein [Fimbriimonadales bacterium]
MPLTIHAIYEQGVLRPLETVNLQEGVEVEIEIKSVSPPKGAWTRFVERIEPLSEEQYEALKRETARRPLFDRDSP